MTPNGKRILLAEDDRFLRRACENCLSRKGYTIVLAEDGEQALEKVRAEPPDLILLDLLMPKVTGIEVLRAIKADETTRDIPVLILTNSSRENDVKDILGLGADGYQIKGIFP